MKQKKVARMLAMLTSVFMLAGETLPAFAAGSGAGDGSEVTVAVEASDEEAAEEEISEGQDEAAPAVVAAPDKEGEGEEGGEGEGEGGEGGEIQGEHRHKVSARLVVDSSDLSWIKVWLELGGKIMNGENGNEVELECEDCHKKLRASLHYCDRWEGGDPMCGEEVDQHYGVRYELQAEDDEEPQIFDLEEDACNVRIPATGIHSFLKESRCTPRFDWHWEENEDGIFWVPEAEVECWWCEYRHNYNLDDPELTMESKTEGGVTTLTATLTLANGFNPESGQLDKPVSWKSVKKYTENGFSLQNVSDVYFTGKAQKIDGLQVIYGRDRYLQEGVDYTVKYTNNKKVGTASVTVTGKGKFKGSISQDFQILPLDVSGDNFHAPDVLLINNGKAQKKATVLYKDGKVVPKSAYTIEYNDKGDYASDGFYVATIKGKAPNYTGSRQYFIRISDTENKYTDVKKAKVTVNSDQLVMTRNGLDWDKFWERNEDGTLKAFTVSYQGKDVTNAFHEWSPSLDEDGGSGYCTVYADPGTEIDGLRFWGTIPVKVKLKTKDINSLKLEGLPAEVEWNNWGYYSGDDLNGIGMRLMDGEDELNSWEHYEVKIKGGKKVGNMTVTITGRRGYSGKIVKKVKIVPKNLKTAYDAGKARIGEYAGQDEEHNNIDFREVPADILYAKGGAVFTDFHVFMINNNVWDDDNGHHDEWYQYWLEPGKDFTVTYANNVKLGDKATVTVNGKGNYSGTVEFTATVAAREIDPPWVADLDIRVNDVVLPKNAAKNMGAFIPKVEVIDMHSGKKLQENVDYTLKYYRYIDEDNEVEIKADDPAVEVKLGDYFIVDVIAVEGSGFTGTTGAGYHVVQKMMKASDFAIKPQVISLNDFGDYDEGWYFANPKATFDDGPYFDVWGASDEDYAAWAAAYFDKIPDGCRIEVGEIKNAGKPGKTGTVLLHVNYAGRPGETYVYGGYATVKFKVVAKDFVKD